METQFSISVYSVLIAHLHTDVHDPFATDSVFIKNTPNFLLHLCTPNLPTLQGRQFTEQTTYMALVHVPWRTLRQLQLTNKLTYTSTTTPVIAFVHHLVGTLPFDRCVCLSMVRARVSTVTHKGFLLAHHGSSSCTLLMLAHALTRQKRASYWLRC